VRITVLDGAQNTRRFAHADEDNRRSESEQEIEKTESLFALLENRWSPGRSSRFLPPAYTTWTLKE
jgi:hypothetical protein